ncbi:MAG TPA: cell division protein FtsL [Haliangiales bacterium]|nr:cell division protein FtsL [Haliangiales bacterium]
MKNKAFALVGSFVVLVAVGLGHVSLRYRVIRVGYALAEKLAERRGLEEENRQLRLEEALLRNPARVEHIARDQLRMERPDPARIRVVRPGVREVAVNADRTLATP